MSSRSRLCIEEAVASFNWLQAIENRRQRQSRKRRRSSDSAIILEEEKVAVEDRTGWENGIEKLDVVFSSQPIDVEDEEEDTNEEVKKNLNTLQKCFSLMSSYLFEEESRSTRLQEFLVNELNHTEALEAKLRAVEEELHVVTKQKENLKKKSDSQLEELEMLTRANAASSSSFVSSSSSASAELFDKRLLGRFIGKKFPGYGLFYATVATFQKPYYKVVYEDGDCEDLTPTEVRKLLCDKSKINQATVEAILRKSEEFDFDNPAECFTGLIDVAPGADEDIPCDEDMKELPEQRPDSSVEVSASNQASRDISSVQSVKDEPENATSSPVTSQNSPNSHHLLNGSAKEESQVDSALIMGEEGALSSVKDGDKNLLVNDTCDNSSSSNVVNCSVKSSGSSCDDDAGSSGDSVSPHTDSNALITAVSSSINVNSDDSSTVSNAYDSAVNGSNSKYDNKTDGSAGQSAAISAPISNGSCAIVAVSDTESIGDMNSIRTGSNTGGSASSGSGQRGGQKSIAVEQYDLQSGETIQVFSSGAQAAKACALSKPSVYSSCRGRERKGWSFGFRYADPERRQLALLSAGSDDKASRPMEVSGEAEAWRHVNGSNSSGHSKTPTGSNDSHNSSSSIGASISSDSGGSGSGSGNGESWSSPKKLANGNRSSKEASNHSPPHEESELSEQKGIAKENRRESSSPLSLSFHDLERSGHHKKPSSNIPRYHDSAIGNYVACPHCRKRFHKSGISNHISKKCGKVASGSSEVAKMRPISMMLPIQVGNSCISPISVSSGSGSSCCENSTISGDESLSSATKANEATKRKRIDI